MPGVSPGGREPGELALVLHTHMPYVEGFGTWPFGEEWLWEAVATSYLPLLDVLGRAPITLSLTPVLCDQLEAPGVVERCLAFLRDVRPESHWRDIVLMRERGADLLVAELERSAAEYAAAADRLERLPGGLLEALAPHAAWTSSATHAVLPLLASDAGAALQVQTGVASHRRRFGDWAGGFWLPECAHAPWLDQTLEEAGVRSTCVELTDAFGLGDPAHLHPIATDEGPVLWPVDRQIVSLVWGDKGLPVRGCLPRLPQPDRPRPSRVAQRRRPVRPRRRARAGGAARRALRGTRPRAGRRRAVSVCARWTPSCSATGGTRACTGSTPSSSRPPGRG